MTHFFERLAESQAAAKSRLCIGLDPDPAQTQPTDIFKFNRRIIEETADLACAYKLNFAFYEVAGLAGLQELAKTVALLRDQQLPALPIIADAKRSDVAHAAKAYAQGIFNTWGFDASTVSPYGGVDSVMPFLDHPYKGTYLWSVSTEGTGSPATPRAVPRIPGGQNRQFGLVIGANQPAWVVFVRRTNPSRPLLLPGIGTQGGDAGRAAQAVRDVPLDPAVPMLFTVSRAISYADNIRGTAQAYRDAINNELS